MKCQLYINKNICQDYRVHFLSPCLIVSISTAMQASLSRVSWRCIRARQRQPHVGRLLNRQHSGVFWQTHKPNKPNLNLTSNTYDIGLSLSLAWRNSRNVKERWRVIWLGRGEVQRVMGEQCCCWRTHSHGQVTCQRMRSLWPSNVCWLWWWEAAWRAWSHDCLYCSGRSCKDFSHYYYCHCLLWMSKFNGFLRLPFEAYHYLISTFSTASSSSLSWQLMSWQSLTN